MCCSLRRAKLTNTILYAAETMHQGHLVHVMGYQNRAANQSPGANAMLLPIPSDATMGPDNMLDTTEAKHCLKDYADAVRTHNNGDDERKYGGARSRRSVQVFNKGSYTVALADSAKDLTAALNYLPVGRRPSANPEIFAAYDRLYPDWKMALCSWDGTIDAEPLLWWYEPKDVTQLFLPALDAHDGHPPKLGTDVAVDHTLVVASITSPAKDGLDVSFRDPIPAHLKPFLASRVSGHEVKGGQRNGDFGCRLAQVHQGTIQRIAPPGKA